VEIRGREGMEEFDINDVLVTTSTTIRKKVWEDIRRRGWKVSDLVLTGYELRINNHSVIDKIDELEKQNRTFQSRLERIYSKYHELKAGDKY
jgi:hypothetical protein